MDSKYRLYKEFIQHAIIGGNIEIPRRITTLHWENAIKNRPSPVDYSERNIMYCECGYPVCSEGYEYKDNIKNCYVFICNRCYENNLSIFAQYDKSLKRPIDDMCPLMMPDLNANLTNVRYGITTLPHIIGIRISEVIDKLERYGHFSKEKLRYLDFKMYPEVSMKYPPKYEGIRLAFYGITNYGYILYIEGNGITLFEPGCESQIIKYNTLYYDIFIDEDILKLL